MHWTVAAQFVKEQNGSDWLMPYIPGNRHQFTCIPCQGKLGDVNWHNRATEKPTFKEWQEIWHHAGVACQAAKGGIITVFPQLAATVGLQRRFVHKRIPVVAWWFNVNCYSGIKNHLARASLNTIERFVVHTRYERTLYSQWLGIPEERFEFVPLQVGEIPVKFEEETDRPFLVATGSASRDFATLFEAVKQLNIRTIVISGPRALEGLTIPSQVETPFGLPKHEIWRLVQQARVSVVPCIPCQPAPGIVTVAEAMRMSRPTIATRITGIDDYIMHGETGLLVEPHSVDSLVKAIDQLWNDKPLRDRLGEQAGAYAANYCSDEAAGLAMARVLDQVADQFEMRSTPKLKIA